MSDQWQHALVWLAVAITLAAFGLRFWRQRRRAKKGGCGSRCGCKATQLPEQRLQDWRQSPR
ncbi:MAG: hypothetical protein ACFB20_00850 [Opitutales bacterium]